MKPSRGGLLYRVSWWGYDQTYDTWEPRENVLDSRLIKDFDVTLQLSIPLQQPMGQLREVVAAALTKMKHATEGMCVEVPLAAQLEVARAMIERAAKPPSRRGYKPLPIEYDTGKGWRTMQLQLEQPEDIAWLVQLHLQRDGAYGCAILKKGRGGNSNMTVLGGPLVLSFTEPVPRDDGVYVPGASFTLTGNVWIFNGRDGAPLPSPGLPNATFHARTTPRVRQERASRPRTLGAEAPPR